MRRERAISKHENNKGGQTHEKGNDYRIRVICIVRRIRKPAGCKRGPINMYRAEIGVPVAFRFEARTSILSRRLSMFLPRRQHPSARCILREPLQLYVGTVHEDGILGGDSYTPRSRTPLVLMRRERAREKLTRGRCRIPDGAGFPRQGRRARRFLICRGDASTSAYEDSASTIGGSFVTSRPVRRSGAPSQNPILGR
jgi:hypothetical protein